MKIAAQASGSGPGRAGPVQRIMNRVATVSAEAGKARILVGPDAYVFDALARVAPTHYYDVMERLDKRLRAGTR